VINFIPQSLYLSERTLVPLEYDAGWVPKLGWIFWRREKSFVPARIGPKIVQPAD
jgi:hypothetical protein